MNHTLIDTITVREVIMRVSYMVTRKCEDRYSDSKERSCSNEIDSDTNDMSSFSSSSNYFNSRVRMIT